MHLWYFHLVKLFRLRQEYLIFVLQNYLAPLYFKDPVPRSNTLSKLEVFSLKLFKQSLELAKQRSSAAQHLIALCHLAVSSLQMCAGVSGKLPPLSFEKLLLHFIQLCLSQGGFKDGLALCAVLRRQLSGQKEGVDGKDEARRKEEDTLLKHAFELAWKAALSIEQDGGVWRTECASQGVSQGVSQGMSQGVSQVADVCLDLREEAFTCLLSATDMDASFVASRLLKSSLRYQKSIASRGKGQRRKCYQRLHHFHTSLLLVCDLPALLSGPQEAPLAVEYLTHLVKVAHCSGRPLDTQQWLQRAEQVCGSLGSERRGGRKGRTGKGRGGKPESDLSVERAARSSQLSALSLVTQTLVDLLISGDDSDEYPDIETPRSSKSPALPTPPPPPPPPPHLKQMLVESCMRLLSSSRDIISRAPSGVLAEEEHRWLGGSAYNLGLALFRDELVAEACPVLQMSCEELRVWCEGGESDKDRGERWEEVSYM